MEIIYKTSVYKDILNKINAANGLGKTVDSIVITPEEAAVLQENLVEEMRAPMVDGKCYINQVLVEVSK